MSSTNRSNARDEHVADYYVTPIADIELFLKEFNKRINFNWNTAKIIDCCAGGNPEYKDKDGIKDAYHPMSYPTAIHNMCSTIGGLFTYDIREDSFADFKEDYLKTKLDYQPDMVITNPPFNIATDIIEKALSDIKDGGYVIMLLRLNFFGSQLREEFFSKYIPEWCFVHHIRIGFTDKKDDNGYTVINKKTGIPKHGSTDSIEYAHYVFRKNIKPDYTKLVII